MTMTDITPKKIVGVQADAEAGAGGQPAGKKKGEGKDSDESSDDSGDGDRVAPMAAALNMPVDKEPQRKENKTPTDLLEESDHLLGIARKMGPQGFQDPSRCKASDHFFDNVVKSAIGPLRKIINGSLSDICKTNVCNLKARSPSLSRHEPCVSGPLKRTEKHSRGRCGIAWSRMS